MVTELSNGEFTEFIKEGTALIDFYADWCMPCVMMGPVVDDMAERFEGKINFGKVNIEDEQKLAEKYNVSSIPNFVVFKDGKVIKQFIGGMDEEDFEEKLNSILN